MFPIQWEKKQYSEITSIDNKFDFIEIVPKQNKIQELL